MSFLNSKKETKIRNNSESINKNVINTLLLYKEFLATYFA